MRDEEQARVLGNGLVMTLRVIGPWWNGDEWFTAVKLQPPSAAMLLPLASWVDTSISMASTTLPWQLFNISSRVVLLWWGKSLLSNSIGGCPCDKAFISLEILGYLNSSGLSWKLSKKNLLSWLGLFAFSGTLAWWAKSDLSSLGSSGSALTWSSGECAALLGLGFSSSSPSDTEPCLFKEAVDEIKRMNC